MKTYLRNSFQGRRCEVPIDVHDLADLALALFGANRLACFLLYGSRLLPNHTIGFRDIDVYLLLADFAEEDYDKLREIKSCSSAIDLTFQYLSDILAKPRSLYQLGNHGAFYVHVLANAKCLIGVNPFPHMAAQMPDRSVRASLFRQIEEHLWRIDDISLSSDREDALISRYLLKYLWRSLVHLLIVSGYLSFAEAATFSATEIAALATCPTSPFGPRTQELVDQVFSGNPTTSTVSDLLTLKRALYVDYLNVVNGIPCK